MPIPLFLLEFRELWGRDPCPDELLPEQKELLLICAQQTMDAATLRWLQTLGGLFEQSHNAKEPQ